MNITQIAKRVERVVSDNSPAILTAIGVTGTLTTAYLTGKATFRAAKLLADEQTSLNIHNKRHVLDNKEKFELAWHFYVPPAITASVSIAAIIASNRIGSRRTAAITAAYTLSERAISEYKDKVLEKLGENKERQIRDEIAQDRVTERPPIDGQIIITGSGEVLCQDVFSGRYFRSSMETLKKAQNDTNYKILHDDFQTVSDFYRRIGKNKILPTMMSDEMGWNTDKQLELHFTAVLTPDDEPCMVMDFATVPIHEPWRFC